MPERGFAGPEELKILGKAVMGYCERHRIAEPEREAVAARVMDLFWKGEMNAEDLADNLDRHLNQLRKQA